MPGANAGTGVDLGDPNTAAGGGYVMRGEAVGDRAGGTMAAIGDLSIGRLGLKVPAYDARAHYEQVEDKWFGTRTQSGE